MPPVRPEPPVKTLATAKVQIATANASIVTWAAARLAQVQEGFLNQLGATLADPKAIIAAWLLISGKLDAVIAAVTALLA